MCSTVAPGIVTDQRQCHRRKRCLLIRAYFTYRRVISVHAWPRSEQQHQRTIAWKDESWQKHEDFHQKISVCLHRWRSTRRSWEQLWVGEKEIERLRDGELAREKQRKREKEKDRATRERENEQVGTRKEQEGEERKGEETFRIVEIGKIKGKHVIIEATA